MDDCTGILPGLPAVAGKPVHVGSTAAERDKAASSSPRNTSKSTTLASRSNGSPAADKAFNRSSPSKNPGCPDILDPPHPPQKQAIRDQKQPVFRGVRLENLPGATALKRMMAAMVELFCDSFDQVPRRILLDIDDTEDRVHGGQQLSLWQDDYPKAENPLIPLSRFSGPPLIMA